MQLLAMDCTVARHAIAIPWYSFAIPDCSLYSYNDFVHYPHSLFAHDVHSAASNSLSPKM